MAAMLDVEQTSAPSMSAMNFEELFNMDLFGPSTQSVGATQSRSSSQSPGSSYIPMPTADNTIDPSFFNFDLPSTFSKPLDLSASPSDAVTSPASSVPFDFFGSFSGSGSSPETAPSSAFSPKSLAIDPSLVGAPSPTMPPAPHRSEPEDDSDDSEDDEQFVQPVKVGGRGKAARKGTVAAGGVAKRTPGGNAVKDKTANDDDWRPSPEEYKKMSSKEKRQLRNKISARNFRVRRKEYISTLEGDIADRDRLIDAIRDELGSTKLENVALRQEVDALKRAMLEGRASPILPPPAPLTGSANVAPAKRTTRTSLAKPNTQKDLPTSPRVSAARAFWGGNLGGAGGITPVHATLVPEFQQENINPALNLACFGGVGTTTPNPKFPLTPFQQQHLGANFDAFADLNPFTLKTLDAYRMQLWGRMAREAGQRTAAPQSSQPQSQPQSPPSGLTTGLRPAFFTAPPLKERDTNKYTSPTLSALLSGKSAAAASPSPAASYPSPPASPEIQPQHAMLASLASQTLLSKMGSAFWDAFAGRSSKNELDHDKVRRVLEGKAVVRVVDVDSSADTLEESMRGLSIGSVPAQVAGESARGPTLFSRTRAAVVGKK